MFAYQDIPRSYPNYYDGWTKDISGFRPAWHYYGLPGNKRIPNNFNKLHITLDTERFDACKDRIHDLLHQALQQRLFVLYKVFVLETERLHESKGQGDWLGRRQMNAPFVIYLNEKYDDNSLRALAEFCVDMDEALAGVKPGEKAYRANCDLEILNHVLFRQAELRGEYVAANDSPILINELAEEARNSIYFKKLNHYIVWTKCKRAFLNEINSANTNPDKLQEIFNQLANLVIQDILLCENATLRAATIEHWIGLMDQYMHANDLNVSAAINLALNHDIVKSLVLTQSNISAKSTASLNKANQQFKELEQKKYNINSSHLSSMLSKETVGLEKQSSSVNYNSVSTSTPLSARCHAQTLRRDFKFTGLDAKSDMQYQRHIESENSFSERLGNSWRYHTYLRLLFGIPILFLGIYSYFSSKKAVAVETKGVASTSADNKRAESATSVRASTAVAASQLVIDPSALVANTSTASSDTKTNANVDTLRAPLLSRQTVAVLPPFENRPSS